MNLFFLCAQNERKADSLRKCLVKAKEDTSKCKTLNNLVVIYVERKPDSAKKYNELLFALSQKLNTHHFLYSYYISAGNLQKYHGDLTTALKQYLHALNEAKLSGNAEDIGRALYFTGTTKRMSGDFAGALQDLGQAEKLLESFKNESRMMLNVFNAMANTYSQFAHDQKSIPLFLKAQSYYYKSLESSTAKKDTGMMGNCLNNLSITYTYMQEINEKDTTLCSKAIDFATRSLKLRALQGDSVLYYKSATNLASAYLNAGGRLKSMAYLEKSIYYLEKGLRWNEAIGDTCTTLGLLSNIGAALGEKGKITGNAKEFERAKQYVERAIEYSYHCKQREERKNELSVLSDILMELKDYKNAALVSRHLYWLADSINQEFTSGKLEEMITKYDTEKKEKENALLRHEGELSEQKLKQEKTQFWFLVSGLFFVLLGLFFVVNRFRVTRKQKKIIEEQKLIVDDAFKHLDEKNKEVMDSIRYAKRIQTALITSEKYIERKLNKLVDHG